MAADQELEALMEHLRSAAPWNVIAEVEKVKFGWPLAADMSGPVLRTASTALEAAFGRPAEQIGSGGCIQLVATLPAPIAIRRRSRRRTGFHLTHRRE